LFSSQKQCVLRRSIQKTEILCRATTSIARAEQVEAKLAQQQAAWDVERAHTKWELDECYKKIDFIQNEREALVIKNEELNADIRGEPFD
jgi:hypothetical protein